MPGAAHRLVDDETFGKGAIVMGAMRAYCEDLVSSTREQDGVIADADGGGFLHRAIRSAKYPGRNPQEPKLAPRRSFAPRLSRRTAKSTTL